MKWKCQFVSLNVLCLLVESYIQHAHKWNSLCYLSTLSVLFHCRL